MNLNKSALWRCTNSLCDFTDRYETSKIPANDAHWHKVYCQKCSALMVKVPGNGSNMWGGGQVIMNRRVG